MNKIVKIGLSCCVLAFVVGCSDVNKPNVTKTAPQKKHTTSKPQWIFTPNMNGYQGVVSIISKKKVKNKQKLYYIAKLKAQALFEQRKGTVVNSSSTIKTDSTGKIDYKEKINIKSNSIQTKKLIVKSTYEDKDNYYMWMVVK